MWWGWIGLFYLTYNFVSAVIWLKNDKSARTPSYFFTALFLALLVVVLQHLLEFIQHFVRRWKHKPHLACSVTKISTEKYRLSRERYFERKAAR